MGLFCETDPTSSLSLTKNKEPTMKEIEKINKIREYFVKNKMFSELRGFNAGVKLFNDNPQLNGSNQVGTAGAPQTNNADMSHLNSWDTLSATMKSRPLTHEECQYLYDRGNVANNGDPSMSTEAALEQAAHRNSKEYRAYRAAREEYGRYLPNVQQPIIAAPMVANTPAMRGNTDMRAFSNPPHGKHPGQIVADGIRKVKTKVAASNEKRVAALNKFGRKPTPDEAYKRIFAGDDDFAEALKLAYPDLYKVVIKKLSQDGFGAPPPYARMFSDGKKTFWHKHKKKILTIAALTAAAGLGYGAKTLWDRYGDGSATLEPKGTAQSTGSATDADGGKAGGGRQAPPLIKQGDDNQIPSKANPETTSAKPYNAEYFTKEDKDNIFKSFDSKLKNVTDFTPLTDFLLEAYDKYCKALETKYIRPEDVRSETEMLKGSTNLFLTLQQQLAQNNGDRDKITKVANMIGRLSRITLKIGTAPAH